MTESGLNLPPSDIEKELHRIEIAGDVAEDLGEQRGRPLGDEEVGEVLELTNQMAARGKLAGEIALRYEGEGLN